MKSDQKVCVTKDGPYLVSGKIPLAKEISVVGKSGEPEVWKREREYPAQESYALCRCGNSRNKPFCDRSHLSTDFDGKETANRESYMKQAKKLPGPGVDLTDCEKLCSTMRFCHLAGGTWNNVEKSDDPEAKKIAIQTSCNCPSGRLIVWDKDSGEPIEPKLEPSIGLIEDPQKKVSGPIWLKGGVQLVCADGTDYEKRNRITLCRCGKSQNKPFCDGSHIGAQFNDGDESLK